MSAKMTPGPWMMAAHPSSVGVPVKLGNIVRKAQLLLERIGRDG